MLSNENIIENQPMQSESDRKMKKAIEMTMWHLTNQYWLTKSVMAMA